MCLGRRRVNVTITTDFEIGRALKVSRLSLEMFYKDNIIAKTIIR